MQELIEYLEVRDRKFTYTYKKATELLEKEKEQMIDLVQSLKDYTHQSHTILGHDEREASEFVEIYYNQTYNQNK